MWYIHIMEYYGATKMNEIRIHATTWMNPENTMLSKISQAQKGEYMIMLM